MPLATASAMERSSRAPLSMTSESLKYTSRGRYLNILSRVKTYLPKYSDGRSVGDVTSSGFFLKASSTTWNLRFAIFSLFDVRYSIFAPYDLTITYTPAI